MKHHSTSDLFGHSSSRVRRFRAVTPQWAWRAVMYQSRRWLLVVALLAAIAAAGVWSWHALTSYFLQNPNYAWRYVELNTNLAMDVPMVLKQVQHVNGGAAPQHLFALNLLKLREVLQQQPGVLDVEVGRQLPQTLRVQVRTRQPIAWLECPADEMMGRPASADQQGYLVDDQGVVFSCPALMWEQARDLPVVVVAAQDQPLAHVGKQWHSQVFERCMALHEKSKSLPGAAGVTMDRLTQENEWSISVWVRDGQNAAGVKAIFGLRDQERQLLDLAVAQRHAQKSGWQMATINLIPSRYVPVTLANESATSQEDAPQKRKSN